MNGCEGARTRLASGRLACLVLTVSVASCAVVETEPAGPAGPAAGPPDPVIVAAPIAPAREAEAGDIFRRASAAYDGGRAAEALELASRVVDEFPASAVSGRALRLQARAAIEIGRGELADAAAERYLSLVPGDDPRVAELRMLQARAVADPPGARLRRLLLIPPSAPDTLKRDAVELARESVGALELPEVTELLGAASEGGVVGPVLEARRAALLLLAGDTAAAAAAARGALAADATGADSVLAEEVLEGRLPDGYLTVRSLRIGAVLPLEGAPAMAAFARSVLEGMEVAAATVLGARWDVDLRVLDNGGDPERSAARVADLERAGAQGVVGFLQEETLVAAAGARRSSLPLVSPTARVGATVDPGVYSLEGVDRGGIRELARYGAMRGYQRVAVIQSTSPISSEAADLFEEETTSFGGLPVGRFTYAEGATFFEPQIQGARDALRLEEIQALGLSEDDTLRVEELDPVAIFVPVPAEDVELIAPQITHFGLDTLGIEVLGTSAWADAQTLARVDPRHTDDVVATAPIGGLPGSPGYERFREAYESHFRRSLVSGVPALGYDAALVLLRALADRSPLVTVSGPTPGLDLRREVEGATGVFTLQDGRIVRRTGVFRIRDRTLNPIPTG